MKFSDIAKPLFEGDWASEYKEQEKAAIIKALQQIDSVESATKVIQWGHFRVKNETGGSSFTAEAKEYFKENPDVEKLALEVFNGLIKNDDDIAMFIKLYYGSVMFNPVVSTHKKAFIDFLTKKITVVDGVLQFDHEEIKRHAQAKNLLDLLIEHDTDMMLGFLKQILEVIPEVTIVFDFDKNSTAHSWNGSSVINVTKGVVPKLYKASLLAYAIDEFTGDEAARKLVTRSKAYKTFSRGLLQSVKKMMTLTEADLYKDEYAFFLNRHGMPDFVRALSAFVELLEDAREIGRNIFSWFYNLPRHGQMHDDKKKFLDSFMEVMSRSNIIEFTKLECIFDNGEKLQELSHFE